MCKKCQKATFCSKCILVASHNVAHEEECPILQQLFSKKSNYLVENSRDQRLLFRLLFLHSREKENKQVDLREGHNIHFVVDSYLIIIPREREQGRRRERICFDILLRVCGCSISRSRSISTASIPIESFS